MCPTLRHVWQHHHRTIFHQGGQRPLYAIKTKANVQQREELLRTLHQHEIH